MKKITFDKSFSLKLYCTVLLCLALAEKMVPREKCQEVAKTAMQ